ncbi:MAG: antibiotic biosynthesis monooxygenase [Opitutaceae bacterium]
MNAPPTGTCPFRPARAAPIAAHPPAAAATAPAFVALSKFVVANEKTSEVKAAFRGRPHLVDGAAGFVRMEVLSPLDRPDEIWLVTFWTDAVSYRTWHHSHLYRDSHRGIPASLKLVPGETKIREFEHVCS